MNWAANSQMYVLYKGGGNKTNFLINFAIANILYYDYKIKARTVHISQ